MKHFAKYTSICYVKPFMLSGDVKKLTTEKNVWRFIMATLFPLSVCWLDNVCQCILFVHFQVLWMWGTIFYVECYHWQCGILILKFCWHGFHLFYYCCVLFKTNILFANVCLTPLRLQLLFSSFFRPVLFCCNLLLNMEQLKKGVH